MCVGFLLQQMFALVSSSDGKMRMMVYNTQVDGN